MSLASRRRKQRCRNFDKLVKFWLAEDGRTEVHVRRGWRYSSNHPFADEAAAASVSTVEDEMPLERGALHGVDAFWEFEGDVYFVEVWPPHGGLAPGLHSRWSGGDGVSYTLHVVTEGRAITRTWFESLLESWSRAVPHLRKTVRLVRVNGSLPA